LLDRLLEMIASNRALVDVLERTYGAEQFDELLQRTIVPLEKLLANGQQAGVVRADVAATDFPAILEMLSAVTGVGVPGLPHRYIGLILAGLRPGEVPLPGRPPTEDLLRQAAALAPGAATPGRPSGPGSRPGRCRWPRCRRTSS
jgi:hypothetical protein